MIDIRLQNSNPITEVHVEISPHQFSFDFCLQDCAPKRLKPQKNNWDTSKNVNPKIPFFTTKSVFV